MPRYKYVAMDSKGMETKGVIDADGQSQAIAAIRSQGYFPTKVTEVSGGSKAKAQAGGGAKKKKMEIKKLMI